MLASIRGRPSGRLSRTVWTISRSVKPKCRHGPTCRHSGLRDRTSKTGRCAIRRGAQQAQPCVDAQTGRQPDSARRTDERPGCRDSGFAGECSAELPRLRRGDFARSLVLDRTCTHILAWEGDDDNEAKWFWFEGNFGAYEENKVERLGVDAARPHRVTHRKLTRG